jgi:hypothetical protein
MPSGSGQPLAGLGCPGRTPGHTALGRQTRASRPAGPVTPLGSMQSTLEPRASPRLQRRPEYQLVRCALSTTVAWLRGAQAIVPEPRNMPGEWPECTPSSSRGRRTERQILISQRNKHVLSQTSDATVSGSCVAAVLHMDGDLHSSIGKYILWN